ncbi:MAG: ABC transporter ATP-binding protein [Halobacteria archaeon]
MLEICNLNVFHGNLQVLWGIDLKVKEGEIVALIGSNGAGKTTAVETIFGLNKAAQGKIEFMGEDISALPAYDIVRKGLMLIPEKRELFPKMTVLENLKLGAYIGGGNNRLERIFDLFPMLNERKKQLACTLSGGEQQMLAIARGLMSNPKMLVLDEPSIGLSPLLVSMVFKSIKRLNEEGVTILLVEQNVAHALELCNRGYVLESGRIKLEGSSQELLSNEHVRAAYLGI